MLLLASKPVEVDGPPAADSEAGGVGIGTARPHPPPRPLYSGLRMLQLMAAATAEALHLVPQTIRPNLFDVPMAVPGAPIAAVACRATTMAGLPDIQIPPPGQPIPDDAIDVEVRPSSTAQRC